MSLSTRARALIVFCAVFAVVLATSASASADVHPFVMGSNIVHPIGVAVTKDRIVVTQECSSTVMAMDSQGRVAPFATLPPNPGCPEVEDYPVAIPQRPSVGWSAGDVYVIAGNHIYRIDPRGRVSLFTNGPCTADTQAAIGYDRVGTWGGGLIALCGQYIYTINSRGAITPAGNLPGVYGESPTVAPASFPQYGGWLIVAEEFANGGQVAAVSRDGQHVPIGQWPDAEHVDFVPSNVCTWGTTGGAYFDANPTPTTGQLWVFPKADFAGLAGKIIVNGEDNTNIGILYGPGDVRPFDTSNGGTFEGASFVNWDKTCQ